MSIRIASTCSTCESFNASNLCVVHNVKVNQNYVCDSFAMNPSLNSQKDCGTCARHETDSCAHPDRASEGMLCMSWAPKAS
mgnify:CR=1 FL=1